MLPSSEFVHRRESLEMGISGLIYLARMSMFVLRCLVTFLLISSSYGAS